MSNDIKFHENISLSIYAYITEWRNDNEEDNKCTTFAKRFTTTLVYSIIPLVGIIEGIFRGLIGLIAKAISYVTPEQHKERIVEFADKTCWHAFLDLCMPLLCIGSAIHNFTKNEVDPEAALEMFPCFKKA